MYACGPCIWLQQGSWARGMASANDVDLGSIIAAGAVSRAGVSCRFGTEKEERVAAQSRHVAAYLCQSA